VEHQDLVEVQFVRIKGCYGSSGSGGAESSGLTGAEGNNAGTRYNFSNSTVDADQEQVYLDLCASCIATVVFIDVLDFGSNDMTTYMEFLEYINITYKGNCYL
jgi:hypothetical protein